MINKIPADNRFLIFQRDDFKCRICGNRASDGRKLVIDHWNPRSKGGKDDINNLITLCDECNLAKSNIIPDKNI